jgi:hypothetical protein
MRKGVQHLFYLSLWLIGCVLGVAIVATGVASTTQVRDRTVTLIPSHPPEMFFASALLVCVVGATVQGYVSYMYLRKSRD